MGNGQKLQHGKFPLDIFGKKVFKEGDQIINHWKLLFSSKNLLSVYH